MVDFELSGAVSDFVFVCCDYLMWMVHLRDRCIQSGDLGSDIRVDYDFFAESGVRKLIGSDSCKIITSIAMFYDLDDPLSFIQDISALLSVDGVWALELSIFHCL